MRILQRFWNYVTGKTSAEADSNAQNLGNHRSLGDYVNCVRSQVKAPFIGNQITTTQLLNDLLSPEEQKRADSVAELKNHIDAFPKKELYEALAFMLAQKDESARVTLKIYETLSKFGPELFTHIEEGLKSSNVSIRKGSVDAAVAILPSRVKFEGFRVYQRVNVSDADYDRLITPLLQGLAKSLGDEEYAVKLRAATALSQYGNDSIKFIHQVIESDDVKAFPCAASALGDIAAIDRDSFDMWATDIKKIICKEGYNGQNQAAEAIMKQLPRSLGIARNLLDGSNENARRAIASQLQKIQSDSISLSDVDGLLYSAINSKDVRIRLSGIDTATKFSSVHAVPYHLTRIGANLHPDAEQKSRTFITEKVGPAAIPILLQVHLKNSKTANELSTKIKAITQRSPGLNTFEEMDRERTLIQNIVIREMHQQIIHTNGFDFNNWDEAKRTKCAASVSRFLFDFLPQTYPDEYFLGLSSLIQSPQAIISQNPQSIEQLRSLCIVDAMHRTKYADAPPEIILNDFLSENSSEYGIPTEHGEQLLPERRQAGINNALQIYHHIAMNLFPTSS